MYALDADRVVEVVELPAISAWPGAPLGVAGVLDYRGQVVPVIDISARLSGTPLPAGLESDQVIVVGQDRASAALLVNQAMDLLTAQQVLDLPHPLPEPMRAIAPFLRGRTTSSEQVVLVLDLDALLHFPTDLPPAHQSSVEPASPLMAKRARELALPQVQIEATEQRQLVVVSLAGERLGVPVREVAELTHRPPFTPVPGAPAHLLGLAYHRGGLLRLVDIRAMCGLDPNGPLPGQLVILAGRGMPTGLVVDSIDTVVGLKGDGDRLAYQAGWLSVLDTERLDVREPAGGAE